MAPLKVSKSWRAALWLVVAAACQDAGQTGQDTAALGLDGFGGLPFADAALKSDAAPKADGAFNPDSNIGVCPGGSGCPCAGNGECDSGLCLDDPAGGPKGKACARPCSKDCPTDYTCAAIPGPGGDIVSMCVWKTGHLCDPCASSQDCAAVGIANTACVDQGPLGRFCGIACAKDGDCPDGYGCQEVATAEGGKLQQCVRKPDGKQAPFGLCPCSAAATAKKTATACYVETKDTQGKLVGKCAGTRSCGDGGLGACSALAALPEICNGQDDNCNGQTDETDCSDGNACTQDKCLGEKGCAHTKLDATACDADGSVCTKNDLCANGVCQKGAATVCDDGNACTLDACDLAKGCTQTSDDGASCSDNNPCTVGDHCSASQCVGGKPKTCEAFSACQLGVCDATGQCVPAPVPDATPCSDSSACTSNDACKAGKCTGKPVPCDDGNPCTADTCDPIAGCKSAVANVPCDDGNACTDADTCNNGLCAGKPLAAAACDDKSPCTLDACDPKSGCTHAAQNDNAPCTGCGEIACKCGAGKCKPDCSPIDGGWTDYVFGECSAKCGGGTKTGKRTCTNPAPSCGGKACDGSATVSQACNVQACPPPDLPAGTNVFDKGGTVAIYLVPAAVTSVSAQLWGGGGGGGAPGNGGGGAYLQIAVPVKAGDTLEVRVGEGGPPGGGGGASYLYRNGAVFAVAGGGGGAGVDGCSGCTGGAKDGAGGGAGKANGAAQAGTANNKYATNCGGGGAGGQSGGGTGGVCNDQSPYPECKVAGGDGGPQLGGKPAFGSNCAQGAGAQAYSAQPTGGQNGAGGGGGSGWYGGGGGGAKWTYTGGGGGGGSSWAHGDATVLASEAGNFEVNGGKAAANYKATAAKGGTGKPSGASTAIEPGGAGLIVVSY